MPDRDLSPATRSALLRDVSREPLTGLVDANLRERCRVDGGLRRRIVVGASGGPDSTALVLILAALARRREPGPEPIVVCVHHGLRVEADEECAMTARLARRLGLVCERIDVRPAARRGNLSANARDDRYAALKSVAVRVGARAVATAHHADDRLETMLLALARGRGLRGLATPRWTRSLGDGVRLVRPLLDATKDECVGLCERLAIPYASDPSNLDPARARGHLRRSVLPALSARYPGLARHASRTADEAALALRAIDALVLRRFGAASIWPRSSFVGVERAIAAWALRRAAERLDHDATVEVPRRAWDQAARAATNAASRPREFVWSHRLRCTITERDVRIERL